MSSLKKIPVGISSCLIGEKVRFNGGHKYDNFINQRLIHYFDFKPYCPEVAIGMGVPRDPIRLVSINNEIRVQGTKDASVDVTDKLHNYGVKIAARSDKLCGYIFMSRSPSCGMERVKVYSEKGAPLKASGVGAFAQEMLSAHPNMPIEEEGRLNDPGLRENFITRVFTFYRWRRLLSRKLTAASLVEFHARHKLLLMAHNQAAYKRLGRLVAEAGKRDLQQLAIDYEDELMAAMKRQATRKQHCNVLQHLQGYFSKQLGKEDREEMTRLIEDYRLGLVPLVAPLTLMRHHFRHHPNDWALNQVYLDPYPRELLASR
jgi:uncharacterized protein YbgA (DUF1722 family)/uncharacterized protein YbbK (DUF523 family)